jgi:alanine or glycine:cation symporter, AGCS family
VDFVTDNLIDPVSHVLYTYVLIYVLLGVGLYFTVVTRGVQVRMFRQALGLLMKSRESSAEGISSFQAFAIGLASRVGTGNIAGVAVALEFGGPGAIFWMWIVAVIGMATGFVEATLAQLFKVRNVDGSFRGGPAQYIQTGLGSRRVGMVFAVLLIFTFGIAFNMVQANAVAGVLSGTHHVDAHWTAIGLMVLCGPVLYGGVKRVSKAAELVLPAMAGAYLLLALVIVVMHLGRLPGVLELIVKDAFGFGPFAAGATGGIAAALLNGVKRGLFSNEAGMGSAPNAAATAETSHPVKQGLIQALGVAVDTLVVCSATAFIILVSSTDVYDPADPGKYQGAALTQAAVTDSLGGWSTWLVTIMVFVFAFSSVLGNYAYAEVNMDFLRAKSVHLQVFRLVVIASVGLGSVLELKPVWDFADVAMGVMALVNLVAIVLLGKWAFGALRDYEASKRRGADPAFVAAGNQYLPGELRTEVW